MQRAEERIGRGGATGELRSLMEAVWRSVAARGDEVALASKGAGGSWCETTYGELWRCVERLAAGQASLGVVERDVEEERSARPTSGRRSWRCFRGSARRRRAS